jgi:guanine deaminase
MNIYPKNVLGVVREMGGICGSDELGRAFSFIKASFPGRTRGLDEWRCYTRRMPDRHRGFMAIAIEEAYRGVRREDGGPFGACIVRGDEVIATGHNEVLKTNDPTRHAEICAVIRASKILGSPHFEGCEIYSTTEPCVMCFAALHWAQIGRIYFGTTVRDVKKLGFNEVVISNRALKRLGKSPIELVSGVMREECRELLEYWRNLPGSRTY